MPSKRSRGRRSSTGGSAQSRPNPAQPDVIGRVRRIRGRWLSVAAAVLVGLVVAVVLVRSSVVEPDRRAPPAPPLTPQGAILAPIEGQIGWLDLAAPGTRLLTSISGRSRAVDVFAVPGVSFGIAAVQGPPPNGEPGLNGGDLVRLDPVSGQRH